MFDASTGVAQPQYALSDVQVEQRVEHAVQKRLASIEEDRASTNIALDQALQEARVRKP